MIIESFSRINTLWNFQKNKEFHNGQFFGGSVAPMKIIPSNQNIHKSFVECFVSDVNWAILQILHSPKLSLGI